MIHRWKSMSKNKNQIIKFHIQIYFSIENLNFSYWVSLIQPPELEIGKTPDTLCQIYTSNLTCEVIFEPKSMTNKTILILKLKSFPTLITISKLHLHMHGVSYPHAFVFFKSPHQGHVKKKKKNSSKTIIGRYQNLVDKLSYQIPLYINHLAVSTSLFYAVCVALYVYIPPWCYLPMVICVVFILLAQLFVITVIKNIT